MASDPELYAKVKRQEQRHNLLRYERNKHRYLTLVVDPITKAASIERAAKQKTSIAALVRLYIEQGLDKDLDE